MYPRAEVIVFQGGMANISVGTRKTGFVLCQNCGIAELLEITATLDMMVHDFLGYFV